MMLQAAPRRSAFTLIELLVAMTVLTLLIVLVSQLTNGATNTTTASTKRLDADTQARTVFSRMSYDFASMVKRKDVDCFFVKNAGNDAMYFYTDGPGYFSNNDYIRAQSPVSFVGYRVANRPDPDLKFPNDVLERIGVGTVFDGGGATTIAQRTNMVFLTYPSSPDVSPAPSPDRESTIPRNKAFIIGSGPTWDNTALASSQNFVYLVSDGVFRMEFCFLMKDPIKNGKANAPESFAVPPDAGASPWLSYSFMAQDHTGDQLASMRQVSKDVAAVVVTLAVLDTKSRPLVNTAQIKAAREYLDDGKDAGVAKKWSDKINGVAPYPTFSSKTGIVPAVASQIRVYQRFFYLNNK